MKYTYWVLETVTAASSNANGYITAIWDCQGQAYANMDPNLVTHPKGIIKTMRDFYPESLQLLLICNANLIFRCVPTLYINSVYVCIRPPPRITFTIAYPPSIGLFTPTPHSFIWRIILPFLDPRTRQKVQMITE